MQIALVGATGRIGRAIAQEAAERGHAVVPVSRPLDVFNPQAMAGAIQGCQALVSAFGVPAGAPLDQLPRLTGVLVQAARHADLRRVITVGGAGMLWVSPGLRLGDTPDFPQALQPKVAAHADAVEVLTAADDLDWTCVVPPAQIGPGLRSGRYRTAVGVLVRTADGRSAISFADFAVALLDAVEQSTHLRQVLAVGD